MANKTGLPGAPKEKLGAPTIMDRALAASHGVTYVHLAVFSIDVDRIREAVEGYDDPRPFGWEVFLTEQYLLTHFDPAKRPEEAAFFEEVVLSILDGRPDALGSQLSFAVWDAIQRGRFPKRLEGAFRSWKARPKELVKDLAKLWADEEALRESLARGCLEVTLEPPLAPPTVEALRDLADPLVG
ncbi:MAG: hypothetical protein VYE22_01565 [Myxococcota bacterium]|nr:hypothetical protein [Myxococcota bacterium]